LLAVGGAIAQGAETFSNTNTHFTTVKDEAQNDSFFVVYDIQGSGHHTSPDTFSTTWSPSANSGYGMLGAAFPSH
jgi:hypothetical protein